MRPGFSRRIPTPWLRRKSAVLVREVAETDTPGAAFLFSATGATSIAQTLRLQGRDGESDLAAGARGACFLMF